MRAILVILLISVTLALQAQDEKPCSCNNALDEAFEVTYKGQVYQGLQGIIGDEFFNSSYLKGNIYFEDGEVAEDVQLRYNGRIDGLLMLPPNSGREILLDKYFIREFWLKGYAGNAIINFKKIKIIKEQGDDSTEIFGQVLYQNKLSLYAYRRYVYKADKIEDVKNSVVSKASYGPSFIYYFQLPNHHTIGFKSFKKKDLYKLFPGDEELMKKLFKEKHQRKFQSEEDLIRITGILNSLFE